MKKVTVFLAAAIVVALTTTAMAGVVLEQEVSQDGPFGTQNTKRTLQIQGNKQKVLSNSHAVITDLDSSVMILLDPAGKTYTETPFPPPQLTEHQHAGSFKISFKKTGKQSTEQGYKCDEYVGTGHMMMGDYSVTGCFSKQAPGAAEYTAFDKVLASKLKGTPMETQGTRPVGVPLVLKTTTKMDPKMMPGLPPERAKDVEKHPNMVSNTRTTSVKVVNLPADTFTVPAG
ncbi:MAG: hypothetical protein ABSD31_10915, partial [Candidatus Binataceae bacterium]